MIFEDTEWQTRARCIEYYEPRHYFDMSGRGWLLTLEALQMVCETCPVQRECRAYIDEIEGNGGIGLCYGFWAGELPKQRIARRRKARLRKLSAA